MYYLLTLFIIITNNSLVLLIFSNIFFFFKYICLYLMLEMYINRIYDLNFKSVMEETSFFLFLFFKLQQTMYSLFKKENLKITYLTESLFNFEDLHKYNKVYSCYNFYKAEVFNLSKILNSTLKLGVDNDVNVNSCLVYHATFYSNHYLLRNIKWLFSSNINFFNTTMNIHFLFLQRKLLTNIISNCLYKQLLILKTNYLFVSITSLFSSRYKYF